VNGGGGARSLLDLFDKLAKTSVYPSDFVRLDRIAIFHAEKTII